MRNRMFKNFIEHSNKFSLRHVNVVHTNTHGYTESFVAAAAVIGFQMSEKDRIKCFL